MLVWYLSYPYDFRARHLKAHEDPPPYGAGSPFILIGLTLGIFLVSFILTWILKKIPRVKKIL